VTKTTATVRAARVYLERGWAPTPVGVRSKSPLLSGWPERRLGSGDLRLFEGRNVGLLLGSPSRGLTDVDCDWPEAAELAPELLPPTGLVHGRAGSRQSHWWYCSPETRSRVFRVEGVAGRGTVVELRSSGLMTVVPPSLHPSGDRLAWERWGAPARVPASVLRDAVARLALAAVLRSRGWTGADASHLARRPVAEILRAVGPGLREAAAAWLEDRPARRSKAVASSGGELVLGRGSPQTEELLLRLGGVLGAARLLCLPLREGRQPCPFHEGRSRRSLQVTRHVWRCWSGCGQGNAIHLVAKALGVEYREARTWLAGHLDLDSRHHHSSARR
jgi:hypothetical protein